jgi:hypothetical protein
MSVTQSNKSLYNGDHVIKFTDRKTVQSIKGTRIWRLWELGIKRTQINTT